VGLHPAAIGDHVLNDNGLIRQDLLEAPGHPLTVHWALFAFAECALLHVVQPGVPLLLDRFAALERCLPLAA
jgi:hypothetical protein